MVKHIDIGIAQQTLVCLERDQEINRLPVSTSRQGIGQAQGSYQTPLGKHLIRAKIGDGQPAGAVYVGRRPTGEIWCPELSLQYPGRDWILTRILWLSGKEPGHNRLGQVDTMRRYIYIHGTAEQDTLGTPASHGCVRMSNEDVLWLFDWADVGTTVTIVENLT